MEHKVQNEPPKIKLPDLVASLADVSRMIRELQTVDESLLQLSLRSSGSPTKLPKTGYLLEQIVQLNGLNLLQKADRAVLLQYLTALRDRAPVVHISLAAEPSSMFVEKLMTWLRNEVHPEALLTIGLQPTLGVGCVLRTTNKYFDLSLRQDLINKSNLLKAALFGEAAA